MSSLLDALQDLAIKVRGIEQSQTTPPRWATVTQVSPLRIQLDGDTAALAITPENLAGPLVVSSRVLAHVFGKRAIVYGPAQGLPARLATSNYLGSGNNPDTLTENGFYAGYAWAGSLTGFSIGTLLVENYSADWISQTFTTVEAVPRKYIRSRHSGTTWGAWQQIATVPLTDAAIAAAIATATRSQIPSSVVVGSGSASVAADGTITFSGCSSLSLNGIFDTLTPGSYRISGYIEASADPGQVSLRLRRAGATDAATMYFGVYHYSTAASWATTSPASSAYASQTAWKLAFRQYNTVDFTLKRMGVTGNKELLALHGGDGTSQLILQQFARTSSTAAADGLTFLPLNAVTLSGYLKVEKLS